MRLLTLTRPKVSGGSALLALGLLVGCSGDDDERTLTVLAAASLSETFEELAADFEDDHPGVEVRLAFDSSTTLAQQALEGAPADVLATADESSMQTAADALASEPEVFAGNSLVLVTPAADPAGISSLEDLERDDVTWVACVETAPCGKAARDLLESADVTSSPASLEVDVKAVLARVTGDEADAGLVYRTDAIAAGEAVRVVPLRMEVRGSSYPIATLTQSTEPGLAGDFVDLVLSEEGRDVFLDAGFVRVVTPQSP